KGIWKYRLDAAGTVRDLRGEGDSFLTASTTLARWAGEVPQHPPTMFTPNLCTKSFKWSANCWGVSLYRATPPGPVSGSPALGRTEMGRSHCSDKIRTCSDISWGPVAQLSPKEAIG